MVKHLPDDDPERHQFDDDGVFPNSLLPVLIYRGAAQTTRNLATHFENLFASNGWTNSWQDGVYAFTHYHSTAHEVLAVCAGSASLQIGGPASGQPLTVNAGDVIVLPAGVAHQNRGSSDDFSVLGAYADGRDWDLLQGDPGERDVADRNIRQLPLPSVDPIGGENGRLMQLWRIP